MRSVTRTAVGLVRKVKPGAVITAAIWTFAIPGSLVWLYNLRTLQYLLSISNLAATPKLDIIWSAYTGSFYYLRDPIILTRAIFALAAGIEIAIILYVRNKDGTPIYWGKSKIMLFIAALFLVGAVSSLVTSYSAVTLTTDSTAIFLGIAGNITATVFVLYILVSQARSVLGPSKPKHKE